MDLQTKEIGSLCPHLIDDDGVSLARPLFAASVPRNMLGFVPGKLWSLLKSRAVATIELNSEIEMAEAEIRSELFHSLDKNGHFTCEKCQFFTFCFVEGMKEASKVSSTNRTDLGKDDLPLLELPVDDVRMEVGVLLARADEEKFEEEVSVMLKLSISSRFILSSCSM